MFDSDVGNLQVTRIQLALANASLVDLTNASYPHLFKAAQVRLIRYACKTAPWQGTCVLTVAFAMNPGAVELCNVDLFETIAPK